MTDPSSFVKPAKPWKTTRQVRAEKAKETVVVTKPAPVDRTTIRPRKIVDDDVDVTRSMIDNAKAEIRRPLKPRDITFIRAKVDGKNNSEAAMIATGATSQNVASTQAARMLQNVTLREALDEALYRAGLSMDNVAEVIVEATKATKTIQVGKKLVETDTPDHSVRLNAVKALGTMLADRTTPSGGGTVNFNFGTQNFVKEVNNGKDIS